MLHEGGRDLPDVACWGLLAVACSGRCSSRGWKDDGRTPRRAVCAGLGLLPQFSRPDRCRATLSAEAQGYDVVFSAI